MIQAAEVFSIGRLVKPHGLAGELVFLFTDEVFDRTASPFWVLEIDGILVPFFVETYRFRSENSVLVRFEGVHNAKEARFLADRQVFYPMRYADGLQPVNQETSWSFYKGFELCDAHNHKVLGLIEDIDESTQNVLFIVRTDCAELLIPATEDFIQKIDASDRILYMDLPEGLTEIDTI